MKLTSLGHSSFLLEMQAVGGALVRILGDPWLSDYAIGDLMGRAPRVRLDYDQLPDLDAIYLSHSHTDHFDPYTLTEFWKRLRRRPVLLLPHSLHYLVDLLEEYLPGVETIVLAENEPVDFRGVRISGLFNLELRPTNEDDVMMLLVEGERELFLAEADAAFPYHDADAREMISRLVLDRRLRSIALLTIKNELRALMASVNARDVAGRRRAVKESRAQTAEEIDEIFVEYPDLARDLWRDARVVRFVGGQGICYPQGLATQWNHVLFPLPLAERARMEREVAGARGYPLRIQEFLPGSAYELSGKRLEVGAAAEFLSLLDDPADFEFDARTDCFAEFPAGPLVDERRDLDGQRTRILEVLNARFLPYLIGRRDPPIENLLSEHGGDYRVRVRFGRRSAPRDTDYSISFRALRFVPEKAQGEPDEVYWANDLEDYLDGRCDDFSRFCRRPESAAQRLWECLGMPYLNNDLVERKLRLHFENARLGRSLEDWVLGFYRTDAR